MILSVLAVLGSFLGGGNIVREIWIGVIVLVLLVAGFGKARRRNKRD